MRTFQQEKDYWNIRNFLRTVYVLNNRHMRSWHVARLDYWRWHVALNCEVCPPVEEVTYLWETGDGEIAAVLNPEVRGEAFLQIPPTRSAPGLEEEMIAAAEEHLSVPTDEGKRKVYVWAEEDNEARQELLSRQGYSPYNWTEYRRRRSLDDPIPEVEIPAGYTVRSLGSDAELPARSWVSWRAFHPDEPDEDYEGWEWYLNVQRMPLYRRDLDVVAVAPGGEFASFCTIWYDDVTRSGYFEPVGTAPEHQRRGLGRAVLTEGLRRLKRLGGTLACIGSTAPPAHALYSAVGFTDYFQAMPWIKEW
jgi:GNAT superfamily N-acetyltransferase